MKITPEIIHEAASKLLDGEKTNQLIKDIEKLANAEADAEKGRKYPVNTIGEACEAVGGRFLKEQGIAIKTKIPVRVIVTDNKLPEVKGDF